MQPTTWPRTVSNSDFAIVIPAFNEAQTIQQVILESLMATPFVLVVDDGSNDGTGALAREVGALVIDNATNRGLGGTLRRGLEFVAAARLNYAVTIDGDGAHDATRVADMVASHKKAAADLTLGVRFSDPTTCIAIPSSKRAANLVARHLFNSVLGMTLADPLSGMRVFGGAFLNTNFEVDDFSCSIEFIKCALEQNLIIHEWPVPVRYDAVEILGTSRQELLDLAKYAGRLMNPEHSDSLSVVVSKIENWLPIVFDCCGTIVIAHPLSERGLYIFQEQDAWYHALQGSRPDIKLR